MSYYTWCEIKAGYTVYAQLPHTIQFNRAVVYVEQPDATWSREFMAGGREAWEKEKKLGVPKTNITYGIEHGRIILPQLSAQIILDTVDSLYAIDQIAMLFERVDGFPANLSQIPIERVAVLNLEEHSYLKALAKTYGDNNGWELIVLQSSDSKAVQQLFQKMGWDTLFYTSPLLANPSVFQALSKTMITPTSRFGSNFYNASWEILRAEFVECLYGPLCGGFTGTPLEARKLSDDFVDALQSHFGAFRVLVSDDDWAPRFSGMFYRTVLIISEKQSQICLFYAWDDY